MELICVCRRPLKQLIVPRFLKEGRREFPNDDPRNARLLLQRCLRRHGGVLAFWSVHRGADEEPVKALGGLPGGCFKHHYIFALLSLSRYTYEFSVCHRLRA